MAKTKSRIFMLLSLLLVLCMGIFAFASCSEEDNKGDEGNNPPEKPGEIKVSFMVKNAKGEWTIHKDVVVKDGTVEVPSAPAKEYYSFSGWCKDESCKEPFTAKDIKASVKVYAKYAPDEVNVTINGKTQGTKNLVDVVNNNYKPGEGLEFDGWYKDATCKVKWDGKEVVRDLFAKTVAKITITNGYEVLYTTKVAPGEVFESPAKQNAVVEGQEMTLELSILKSYMSKYDIDYVDENGNLIDFTKPVEKSMTITVLWNTKGLTTPQELPKNKEGHCYIKITSFNEAVENAPAISFRNKITLEQKDGDKISLKTYTVDYIYFYANCLPDTAKKLFFGEGIKVIQHLNAVGASQVEEIVLPSTLKILDNSFNNMPKLKGVTLPDGLEVLIDSFFVDRFSQLCTGHTLGQTNTNYEIVVPDSVKNIAMMPNNLKFSKTEATAEVGDFYKGDDGKVYLKHKDGKVLVVDPEAVKGTYNIAAAGMILPKAGTIIVPEGVVGIQVGTYITCFDYLVLPSTFKFVNYNANMKDYAEFYDIYNIMTTDRDGNTVLLGNSGNVLFDESQFKQYFDANNPEWQNMSNLEIEGVAITTNISGFDFYTVIHCGSGILVMPTTKDARPEGIDFGFIKGGYSSSALPHLDNFVNYKDDKNTVFVTCPFENPTTFYPLNITLNLDGLKNIKFADLKDALIAKNQLLADIIKNCKEFNVYANGAKLEDGAAVKADMYITVEIIEKAKLKVSGNYQDSYIRTGSKTDYSKPEAEGQRFESGNVAFALTDIKGLTLDSLKKTIADMGADIVKDSFWGGRSGQEKPVFVANIMYHFEHAKSMKLIANGEEIKDLSSINLDNGSVTLELVFEFTK